MFLQVLLPSFSLDLISNQTRPVLQALDNTELEFERDYLPDLQRRVAEAKARQETAKQVRYES